MEPERDAKAQEAFFRLMDTMRCPNVGPRTWFWKVRFRLFCLRHRGQEFRVFRPEWIDRSFSEDIAPLWNV